jgi:hypothetical protein
LMKSDNIENKLAELKSWCAEKPGQPKWYQTLNRGFTIES